MRGGGESEPRRRLGPTYCGDAGARLPPLSGGRVAGALAARNTMYSIVSPNSIANRNIGAGAWTSAGWGFSVALDEAVTASSAGSRMSSALALVWRLARAPGGRLDIRARLRSWAG